MRTMDYRRAADACARAMIAALALFALLLLRIDARAEADGVLRVRLARLGAPSELTLTADCEYSIAPDEGLHIPAGVPVRITASEGSLMLHSGDDALPLGAQAALLRQGTGHSGFSFLSPSLSNRFCGDLALSASGDVVTVVLNIDIEDYLHGVVGYEMAPSSGLEALKAQAVVARNYALMRKAARNGSAYDLSDSGDALSFRGYSDSREYADAVKAVDETRGQVLTYNGSPAVCYFCDSNGGQTESAGNAFDTALAYSEVRDDPYDYEGAGAKKTATLRRDATDLQPELAEALYAALAEPLKEQGIGADPDGIEITAIEDAALEAPRFEEPSRLFTTLALRLAVTAQAQTVEVTVRVPTYGALERWYGLDINEADNETVWLSKGDRAFEITFRRSGSGVGMSQRGAQVMARKGLSCRDILEYYYPGTALEIVELSNDAKDAPASGEGQGHSAQPIATARLSQKSRLYAKPDTAQGALTTLPAGATVDIYAVQGEWAAIGSGALQGFTHTEALTSFKLIGVTAAQVKNDTLARVNAGPVDVLQLPVATATVLEQLAEGSAVRLDAYTDDWALVTTSSGVEGFISRDALTLQGTTREGDEGETVTAPDNLYGMVTERTGLYVNADDSIDPRELLEAGDYVKILAYNSAWGYVLAGDGVNGYVKLSALSAVQRAEATPAPDGNGITVVEGKQYRIIAAEALSLFKSYSTESQVLATLRRGDRVQIGAYNDTWACVRVDGVTGFVLLSGLADEAPEAEDDQPNGGKAVRVKGTLFASVNADGTPLYPTYDAASTPMLLLDKGEQVQVGAYNDVWACVRVNGITGFIPLEALTLAEP